MMGFRHADRRFPPLWESAAQPAARWHADMHGPAHYFADTPDGAWTEFLRHEEIVDPDDLAGIDRAMWVMVLPDDVAATPALALTTMTGGYETRGEYRVAGLQLESLAADLDHILALDGAEEFILCEVAVFCGPSPATIRVLDHEHGAAGVGGCHLQSIVLMPRVLCTPSRSVPARTYTGSAVAGCIGRRSSGRTVPR